MSHLRGFGLYLYATAKGQSGGPLQQLRDLTPYASAITFDKVAQGGMGTLTCTLVMPFTFLTWLYDQGPALHVELWDYSLTPAYEGMVFSVELAPGGSRLSQSLAEMYSQVSMNYGRNGSYGPPTVPGSPGWISRNRFGRKVTTLSGGIDADYTAAVQFTNVYLKEHAQPVADMSPEIGGRSGQIAMTLTAQGYWNTLGWARYAGSVNQQDTGLQMRQILTTFTTGGTNQHGYISTDYSGIPKTNVVTNAGVTNSQNGQERMIWLMNLGDSNKVRIMGGVGAGRKFRWFSRDTTSPAYSYDLWENCFHDAGGAIIPKHRIEPGHFVRVRPLWPVNPKFTNDPLGTYDVAQDPYCVFIDRCVYMVDTDTLRPSPTESITMEQFLRRVIRHRGLG
ncbi:MAG: hypothetical protein WCF84_07135 [Anaerolineae bacterium]